MHALDMESVELASFRLRDVNILWFKAWERSRGSNAPPVKWEDSLEAFLAHFLPREVQVAKVDQLLSVKQRNMSVREYSFKFVSLAKYIFSTTEARIHRYMDGLESPMIRK